MFQKLCEIVCEYLAEESNVQPVSSPVTVCGDIHGQVGYLYISFIMNDVKWGESFMVLLYKSKNAANFHFPSCYITISVYVL